MSGTIPGSTDRPVVPMLFPMTELELRPNRHVLPAGTVVWRVHKSHFAPSAFNPSLADIHFDGGRFDGTVLDPYRYLYVADCPVTALAESVLRSREFEGPFGLQRIPYLTVHGRSLSALRTRCELNLVSLIDGKDLAAVCQSSQLLEDEANYARARRWSSEIRAQAPDAAGLAWDSRRNRGTLAAVIYHDRFAHCDGEPLEPVLDEGIPDLGSPSGRQEANALLAELRAEISAPGH